MKTTCTGVEAFNKTMDEGHAGDNVGVPASWREAGGHPAWTGLAQPGSITPHTKFEGEVYILSKEEGGRHTPFFSGYRPQFYFRTTDVTGTANLLGGAEMCMPGDNAKLVVELSKPIAMDDEQSASLSARAAKRSGRASCHEDHRVDTRPSASRRPSGPLIHGQGVDGKPFFGAASLLVSALAGSRPPHLKRGVAQLAEHRISKSGGWGFKSLRPCCLAGR